MKTNNMRYWMFEYIDGSRYETLLDSETEAEAIREAEAEFNALSDHDKARRDSVEVWLAPRLENDEDIPDTLIIPDDDNGDVVHTVK